MLLLIDNYDSFVFNLQRYLRRLGQETRVVRNDQVPMEQIASGVFDAIVLSPGPKAPQHAGQCLEVIERFARQVPMLGVCLGHQAICQAFGGPIVRAPRAVHGRASQIHYTQSPLFRGLPNPFQAARYHSLIAQAEGLPDQLRVIGTCQAEDGQSLIMAVEHASLPLYGVQFHPESILSQVGYQILANFLSLAGLPCPAELPPDDFAHADIWSSFQHGDRIAKEIHPPVVLPQRPQPHSAG